MVWFPMKAFTVFVVLPASATADGVLSHESIYCFRGSSSIGSVDGVLSMEKQGQDVFPLHFNEARFMRFIGIDCV